MILLLLFVTYMVEPESRMKQSFIGYPQGCVWKDAVAIEASIVDTLRPCSFSCQASGVGVWDVLNVGVRVRDR